MLGLLWAFNHDHVDRIYDMLLARAVGLKETNTPILPVYFLPAVILLVHLGGFILFTFVELPVLTYFTK